MKLYKIFYPILEKYAKFKTLLPEEIDAFVEKHSELQRLEYVISVLDVCVYNLKTEIMPAIRQLSLSISSSAADNMLMFIYNGCVMLNPGLDIDTWMTLTQSYNACEKEDEAEKEESKLPPPPPKTSSQAQQAPSETPKKKKPFSIPYAKFANLEPHLNDRVIGQKEAVRQVSAALKRAQASLNDPDRPTGVFLLAGPSGVGKSLVAKELQKYLFESNDLVRIDCGEYQHKHENQKLTGSPNGFVGFDEGGQLTKAISRNPNTVLLIDEAEKAHPDFWNTFLKVFDEGFMTDNKGNNVSFKNTLIIITSNLGNDKVSEITYSKGTGFNSNINTSYDSRVIPKREMIERETIKAIHKFFKPELLNRLDDIVIFNHLSEKDFRQIAELEMHTLANKLSKQHFDLAWDEDALELLSQLSGASIEGARGMSRVRRDKLENTLADLLINTKHPKGTIFNITVNNADFVIT